MRILWWLQLNHWGLLANKDKNFVAFISRPRVHFVADKCSIHRYSSYLDLHSLFYGQRSNRCTLNLIIQKYRKFVLGNSLAFVLSCWNKHANFVLSAVFQNFLSRNFVLATLSPIEYLDHHADVGPFVDDYLALPGIWGSVAGRSSGKYRSDCCLLINTSEVVKISYRRLLALSSSNIEPVKLNLELNYAQTSGCQSLMQLFSKWNVPNVHSNEDCIRISLMRRQ